MFFYYFHIYIYIYIYIYIHRFDEIPAEVWELEDFKCYMDIH